MRDGIRFSIGCPAAGLPTVVTVSAYTDDQSFPGALAVLDHLGEPDRPCSALAGRAPSGPCLDLGLLRRLLSDHPP